MTQEQKALLLDAATQRGIEVSEWRTERRPLNQDQETAR
jgi:hypothetical protein